ncbi:MAG: damage-inducible protein CinA [Candidatus Anoxymicrobium japonicum]|uniref:CinA-like protein n=1 Tax=Candidatus Anoxymicrobium japonicum TaxID=2013648 RepID=A0A2N3G6L3_9ACTN|nr:MAG: damage-inducible protein CinA [Candidatus Anoxymicrobium japonicum]
MKECFPRIGVLTVGDELLSCETLDTNVRFIASSLGEAGFVVSRHVTVPDNVEDISREVRALSHVCEAVIVTGGLGPTSDDLTRESISSAVGKELVFHPSLKDGLERFFKRLGRPMAKENLSQAYLPQGAVVIPPAGGTAPGFMIARGAALIVALPGVPKEMQSMLATHVMPELARRFPTAELSVTRRIMTFGMGESDVAGVVADLIDAGSVKYGFLATEGVVVVKLTARGADAKCANAMLDVEQAMVAERLGNLIFAVGDRSMEDATGELLRERALTIATAESVTAGMVSSRIANTPGSSAYLRGGVVAYSADEKTRLLNVPANLLADGAVSEDVAEAMAHGARALFDSDLAIATTGIAGPGSLRENKPVGTVVIALAHEKGVLSQTYLLPGDRMRIRNVATLAALNMVRLHLA